MIAAPAAAECSLLLYPVYPSDRKYSARFHLTRWQTTQPKFSLWSIQGFAASQILHNIC